MLHRAMPGLPIEGGLVDRSNANDTQVVFRDIPPATESGKALLYNSLEQTRAGLGLPQYQTLKKRRAFTLLSPSSEKRTNSTFGGTKANRDRYQVEICQQDAEANNLSNSQTVKLVNEQAELKIELCISDRVKPGTAYVPKGAWLVESGSNNTINALIPGHKADMADGACYNDTQIDIVAL